MNLPNLLHLLAAVFFTVTTSFLAADDSAAKPEPQQRSLLDALHEAAASTPKADTPPSILKRPFFWRIDGLAKPIYMYGTVHVPDERVTNVPPGVLKALAESDVICPEIDPDGQDTAEMMKNSMLPEGTKLIDVIGDKLFVRLATIMDFNGHSVAMFQRFRPWLIPVVMAQLEYLDELAVKPELDGHLIGLVQAHGGTVRQLETNEEHMSVFTGLSEKDHVKLLDAALTMVEQDGGKLSVATQRYLTMYIDGDLDKIQERSKKDFEDLAKIDRDLATRFRDLIGKRRNIIMVDRMLQFAEESPDKTHFIAVGVAHYPGDDGILALLAAKGHKVTRLDPNGEPAEQQ